MMKVDPVHCPKLSGTARPKVPNSLLQTFTPSSAVLLPPNSNDCVAIFLMDAPTIATSLAEYIKSHRSLKWSERALSSDGDGVIVDLADDNDLSNLEAMLVILQVMISKVDIAQ